MQHLGVEKTVPFSVCESLVQARAGRVCMSVKNIIAFPDSFICSLIMMTVCCLKYKCF